MIWNSPIWYTYTYMLSKITEQVRHILCQDRSKVSQTITQYSSQICATKPSVDQDRLEDQRRNKTLLLIRAQKWENQHTILLCLRRHIQHLATYPHKGLLQQEVNQETEGTQEQYNPTDRQVHKNKPKGIKGHSLQQLITFFHSRKPINGFQHRNHASQVS